jgi:hypothetical protein
MTIEVVYSLSGSKNVLNLQTSVTGADKVVAG